MDHFEQELARMLRHSYDPGGCESSYEERHRLRLYDGVRARQRTRRAWLATGSALTIAALGAVLMALPNSFAQDGPATPRPATSAEPVPSRSTAEPVLTSTGVPVASPHGPSPASGQRTT